jgi:alpha/beta superfamily hydrolase
VPDQRIRPNSVLPARREPFTLRTADGLRLVAELARPERAEPVATMLCLHPLPTQGGMMDSQIFRKAAARLPALADIAVVRFNTRGTASAQGRSDGEFDDGRAERLDVEAALGFVEDSDLPRPWVVGWSFGTDLALRYAKSRHLEGIILLSPPLKAATADDLAWWAEAGVPVVAIVPEFDDYLRPAEARERFAVVPQAEVVAVEGGKHLWVGLADLVLDLVVDRLVPGAAPLPRSWAGEMTHETPRILGG